MLCGQKDPYLTSTLAEGKESKLRNDVIAHSDIIGKRARDSIGTKKGMGVISLIIFPAYH